MEHDNGNTACIYIYICIYVGLRVEPFYCRLLVGNEGIGLIVELIEPATHRSVNFPLQFSRLTTSK